MLDDGDRLGVRVLAGDRATLRPVLGVVQGDLVAGIAEHGGPHADANPSFVHHVEHPGQTLVRGADQMPDAVFGFTEIEHRVDGAAIAHLVVEAGQPHAVARAKAAIVIHQEFGDDEERNALGAWRRVWRVDLGEHHVDDVLGQIVLPAGDPHLGADQLVAAIGLGNRPRLDVAQRGAGLGLG